MKLRSTTWKGRNIKSLLSLRDAALKYEIYAPSIIEIGVGGITSVLADYFPSGAKDDMGLIDKTRRFFLRQADNYLRKHNLYGTLKNYEHEEVLELFSPFNPTGIKIIDHDPRTLTETEKISLLEWDLCQNSLNEKGDIVICYNVVGITPNPSEMLEHVVQCVDNGGLLGITLPLGLNSLEESGFKKVYDTVYRKESS